MPVKSSYRGMVRVTTVTSKHHNRIGKMEDSNYRDGTYCGVLRIDGKRVHLSLKSLEQVNDDEAKKIMEEIGVGTVQSKLNTIVQITKVDKKQEFMSPMPETQALEAARKHKIENPTDLVSIWKLSGHIANPRIIADFVSA